MFKVKLTKNADKELVKVSKTNIKLAKKIDFFLYGVLEKVEQPKLLLNAKKLQNYGNNYYRWRIGSYRIIGIIKDNVGGG